MKKILSVFIFAFVFISAMVGFFNNRQPIVFADESTCQVVATECSIYKDQALTEFVCDQEGNAIKLKHGQILQVLSYENANNPNYIYIETNDEQKLQGYIYRYHVTFNKNDISIYPVFNAKVVAEKARVYNLEMQETELFLQKGDELYAK